MHRRGVVLLLGFLVAIVIVGGSGVRAPWSPTHDAVESTSTSHTGPTHVAAVLYGLRAE